MKYEIGKDELPSEAVISAVAAKSNSDPMELDPLYEFIAPEALDTIFQLQSAKESRSNDIHLEFKMEGYRVTVKTEHVCVRS